MTGLIIIAIACTPVIAGVVISIVMWAKSGPMFDQISTYQAATRANFAAARAYNAVTDAILRRASTEETEALQAEADRLREHAESMTEDAYRKYPSPKSTDARRPQ